MLNFLFPFAEPKIVNLELDYVDFCENKRCNVFSQLCIIGASAAILQGANDLILGFPFVAALDIFLAVILVIGYLLNRVGRNHFAKMFLFITSNISLFAFSAVVPDGVGIYLLFFPLVIFYFISFDFNHRAYAFGFTFLSLFLNIVLLATNYQPFGVINLQPTDPFTSFAINLILSIILVSIAINYLIEMNHLGDELLLKQQEKTNELSREIQEKNKSLKKTNIELDKFVYSTSHDLKAPLSSISGLLNLAKMEKEPVPDSIKTYLDMMQERIGNLDLFIKDILDYSRNSRLDVSSDNVIIATLIDEVFETNKYLENTEHVELIAQIDKSLSCKIDKNRVFRILVNLVSNAIKYSDVSKTNSTVTVLASIESNTIVISVKDNGIGIREESKAKIFDMFYRATEMAEGSGLGLYITHEMVHKMNGSLRLDSVFGEGSTFTLRIPSNTD